MDLDVLFIQVICTSYVNTYRLAALNLLIGTTTQGSGSTVTTYKTIEICAGDTFWTIADEYMPNDMDTRDAIHELREINGMAQTDQLIAGQKLLVPEM